MILLGGKKNMINKVCLFLFFLFKPPFWLMNHPYHKEWDNKLLEIMDKYKFTDRQAYTAKLGNNLIWISNYPYDCFYPYQCLGPTFNIRPSRMTIYKAKEKLEKLIKIKSKKLYLNN